MNPGELPVFQKPPIVELILSLQFEPVPGFFNCHLGAFWQFLGGQSQWVAGSDALPIAPEFERFGEERQWLSSPFGLSLSQAAPAVRLQMKNLRGDRMIQAQNGRLTYNWLGDAGGEYARYRTIRSEFDSIVKQFQTFLGNEGLEPFIVNQWEVTYINQLPLGTVWSRPEDWRNIFTFTAVPPPNIDQLKLESFGGSWSYEIAPRRGRLIIQIQHAKAAGDQREILVFNLTARGPVLQTDASAPSYDEGLELGHQAIVATFAKLASSETRAYWKQEA
jgi:uncharacterized protein (TIGR04255 family)